MQKTQYPDLIKRGKIRKIKSLYCALLLFVKWKGIISELIDYRSLNRMTRKRMDEMFEILGMSYVFLKMCLNTLR